MSRCRLEINHIGVGMTYLPEFLAEARRALISRIKGRTFRHVTSDDAKSFFSARSAASNGSVNSDVVAFASLPYRCLFEMSVGIDQNLYDEDFVILDYGCGDGILEKWLRSYGYVGQYRGYDIDEIQISNLIRSNLNPLTKYSELCKKLDAFDIAVLCNVLVYNSDVEGEIILRNLRAAAKPGASLIVLEPSPRWYWELRFDGLKLNGKNPRLLEKFLIACGWNVERIVECHLLKFSKLTVAPIALAILSRS